MSDATPATPAEDPVVLATGSVPRGQPSGHGATNPFGSVHVGIPSLSCSVFTTAMRLLCWRASWRKASR